MSNATLDILTDQHRDVLAKLDAIEAVLGGGDDQSEAAEFSVYLQLEVAGHFTLEEEALFPALARHLGQEAGPLAVMLAEHAAFRDLQRRLADAVERADAAAQRFAVQEIVELLRDHIAKEDQILFPMAMRLLGPDEWDGVDAAAAPLGPAVDRPHAR